METLRNKAKELLEQGRVKAVIGFEKGTADARRPCFIRKAEDAGRLVWDDACVSNLASYLTRHEIKRLGTLAIAGGAPVLRSLMQLMAERQVKDGDVIALAVGADGSVKELATAQAVEEYLALLTRELSAKDREMIAKLSAMGRAERWAFWQKELQRCVKCYACRNSCPMCYCDHCTMDCNRPQWVPVPAHDLGNLEYHTVRAMHLAGRCVQCGECGRACPVGIPVHLLSFFAEDSTAKQFGQRAGQSARLDYALSTFRPDDKETFIR